MLIGSNSRYLLKKTRSKAKMIEFGVPEEAHIAIEDNVVDLFLLTVAIIGNITAEIIRNPLLEIDTALAEEKSSLEFSSKYFDSYLESKLDEGADDYYLLLGSIAYYLCDFIGSSIVLANKIDAHRININAGGIENALVLLMLNQFHENHISSEDGSIIKYLGILKQDLNAFWCEGREPDLNHLYKFRDYVYSNRSDLELFLCDAFCAIYILKIHHSAVKLLPRYMQLDISKLNQLIFCNDSLKELWPSQRRLGDVGVFAGKSAVIQMPTSSGKTKAISLIISSAFLSERTKLAVVVAPFRALCREISYDLSHDFSFNNTIHVDELSDVLQKETLRMDFHNENQKTVLVATPEKIIYLLRHHGELVKQLGVIVFDEGHLFDEAERGVVYELLISTIKSTVSETVQKVLVSAIIPNTSQISNWLNGNKGVVISDNSIKSTQKTIAMTDWVNLGEKNYGYLYFVNPEQPDEEEFYVPRVIPIVEIKKLKKERNDRFFPEVDFRTKKVLNNDIAIYFGLTLCRNGGVGIFCGKKDTANSILKRIMDIESRGYSINSLMDTSDKVEVSKICNLIKENYGDDNIYYLAGTKAAFCHHAGISNGIKISIEHAIRKGKLNFIVCTSTLAQGVNLPIRYLAISSVYQGNERIKVRDFHNLIGRAGRSGIYTEGTVLFTESFLYNGRMNKMSQQERKWNGYKDLINDNHSEPCSSRILFLITPCTIGYGNNSISINMRSVIQEYYNDANYINKLYEYVCDKFPEHYESLKTNIDFAIKSLGSIESFLMAYLLENSWENCEENVRQIAIQTLAYYLANDEDKKYIIELFEVIAKYCLENMKEPQQRYICSRSLLSVKKMLYIQEWVGDNIESILNCSNTKELFSCLFDCLVFLIDNAMVRKMEQQNQLLTIGEMWIKGETYSDILKCCSKDQLKIKKRKKYVPVCLDDVIKICDMALSYDITVILSAISETVETLVDETHGILDLLGHLSSELKYGLPYGNAITIYELGFSDRVVSQKIAAYFDSKNIITKSKYEATENIKANHDEIEVVIKKFPSFYIEKLKQISSK